MANSPQLALARAISALKKMPHASLLALPAFEAACLIIAASNITELTGLRRRAAQRLHEDLTEEWINQRPLYEVFACMSALWQYDATLISGEQLAWAIRRLINTEVSVGGPYKSDDAISVADNACINLFASVAAQRLPNVTTFLENAAPDAYMHNNEPITSHALAYILLKSAHRHQAPAQSCTNRQSSLYNCMLIFGYAPDYPRALMRLCHQQQANGLWEDAFMHHTTRASRWATTAIAAEALSQFAPAKVNNSEVELLEQHNKVAAAATTFFDSLPQPLRSITLAVCKDVCDADRHHEISLLPYMFGRALCNPPALNQEQYNTLGLANVCSWMAYSIYDDILDDEGSPLHVSTANIAMRAALRCFHDALPAHPAFQDYAANAYAAMDAANAWEVTHCRARVRGNIIAVPKLPAYGNRRYLADRSMAHIIPVMAVLAHTDVRDIKARQIEKAMRNYLIAKQLNDDVHDWQEDLRMGRLSYVVTTVLREARIKPGRYALNELTARLQKVCRQTTMQRVCTLVAAHTRTAKELLGASQLLIPQNAMYDILGRLQACAVQSRDLLEKSRSFTAKIGE